MNFIPFWTDKELTYAHRATNGNKTFILKRRRTESLTILYTLSFPASDSLGHLQTAYSRKTRKMIYSQQSKRN